MCARPPIAFKIAPLGTTKVRLDGSGRDEAGIKRKPDARVCEQEWGHGQQCAARAPDHGLCDDVAIELLLERGRIRERQPHQTAVVLGMRVGEL